MSLPLQHMGSLLEHKGEKKKKSSLWKSNCGQYRIVTEAKIQVGWS